MSNFSTVLEMVQHYSKTEAYYHPVIMMNGIAAVLAMSEIVFKTTLDVEGFDEETIIKMETDRIRSQKKVQEAKLDIQLIKMAGSGFASFYKDKADSASKYYVNLTASSASESLSGIVEHTLQFLPPMYFDVFKPGNTVEDVVAHQAVLSSLLAAEEAAETESGSKTSTPEEVAKTKKETSQDGEAVDPAVKAARDAALERFFTALNATEITGDEPVKKTAGSTGESSAHGAKRSSDPFVPGIPVPLEAIGVWNVERIEERMKALTTYLFGKKLDGNQVEIVQMRVRYVAHALLDAGLETEITKLFDEVSRLTTVRDLESAIKEYGRRDSNEMLAAMRKAYHVTMIEIFDIIGKYRALLETNAEDKLTYYSHKYSDVYKQLTSRVIGQDYAVNEFVQACFDAEVYDTDPSGPQAVFLFAGPPGVGKTFLASNVAEILGRPFKTFDMSGYAIEKSDLSLVGVEPGFKNAIEGTLVGFVEDNPDAILLFDEIEKAHPEVIRLFLSVLDGARMENKLLASNTDFSRTIVIFTTNAGREIYDNTPGNLTAIPTDVIMKELQKEKMPDNGAIKFPPEMCSRLASHHIVMFNHIGITDMIKLVSMKMDGVCKEMATALELDVDYDDRLPLLLLMHYGNIDVRVVTNKAKQFIKKEIYELSRQLMHFAENGESAGTIRKIRLSIDDTRISDHVRDFFDADEYGHIVVTCAPEVEEKFKALISEKRQITFVRTKESLVECDFDDITAFIVDPYFQMVEGSDNILGLDDYDSVGLQVIKDLISREVKAPIYMLECARKVSPIDKNTLYMRGVEDTINIDKYSVEDSVGHIIEKHVLQRKCDRMIKRRKIFDFESLQEAPDKNGEINIKFYDIVVKTSVNPEDEDLLIKIDERPSVRFEDVIGAENAKAELKDFIRYLENPRAYLAHALAVPKGILLYGPPGTGKTMLAKAMAGESDATFISVSAAELRMGGGESNVKRLFDTARKYAPAIIFIDEVDAIAKKRTGNVFSSSAEESMLNMLLTQMDGFETHADEPVFIIAATNFGIDVSDNPLEGGLDPAFMRRFGNKILIDEPNKEERAKFLTNRLSTKDKKSLPNDVTEEEISNIAERTPGETIATLENILELAFRNASRKKKILNDEIIDEAMEEYFYGEERKKNEDRLYRTAIHEASHAYIYVCSGKKPAYMTVVSRGDFGGYMQREDNEGHGTTSREEMIWMIRTSLAGRVGERVVFDDETSLNTGASSDLRNASNVALRMLVTYGMEEGHLFAMDMETLVKSNMMPIYVEKAEALLARQERDCYELIEKGKDKIIALAKVLVEKSHLGQEEILSILK